MDGLRILEGPSGNDWPDDKSSTARIESVTFPIALDPSAARSMLETGLLNRSI
jgi:hypothetical protein